MIRALWRLLFGPRRASRCRVLVVEGAAERVRYAAASGVRVELRRKTK